MPITYVHYMFITYVIICSLYMFITCINVLVRSREWLVTAKLVKLQAKFLFSFIIRVSWPLREHSMNWGTGGNSPTGGHFPEQMTQTLLARGTPVGDGDREGPMLFVPPWDRTAALSNASIIIANMNNCMSQTHTLQDKPPQTSAGCQLISGSQQIPTDGVRKS